MQLITKLINAYALNPADPKIMFKVAMEYDKLDQRAAAFSYYLRAADFTEGDSFEEKWLQYECLILGSILFMKEGRRGHTVGSLLKAAINLLPNRPEAYYYMATFAEKQNNWRDSLMYSQIGLGCTDIEPVKNHNLPKWTGMNLLKFQYAISKWKDDGLDSSKLLMFNVKHKLKLDKHHEDSITGWLKNTKYPHRIPYTKQDVDSLKYTFTGVQEIEKNYARHFQDLFVLMITEGKKRGTFLDIGCGDPIEMSATYLLEKDYDWSGISIEQDERFATKFSRQRKSTIIFGDATDLDYHTLLNQHCIERYIDFLRISTEEWCFKTLEKIPFQGYEFGVIQFQHNAAWHPDGDKVRQASREGLSSMGYHLAVPNVGFDEEAAYEDWWIHPSLVGRLRNKQVNPNHNFAWNYFFEVEKV